MAGPIVYLDRSDIRAGRLDDVKAAIRALMDLVGGREPQLIAYSFFIDEPALRMSVVAVHPDAESLELHLSVGAPGFQRFEGLIDLRSIDVYGRPSAPVRTQLMEKARMLGASATITIHDEYAGLGRR